MLAVGFRAWQRATGKEEGTTCSCLDAEDNSGRGRGLRVITKDGRLRDEGSLRKKGLGFAHGGKGMAGGT